MKQFLQILCIVTLLGGLSPAWAAAPQAERSFREALICYGEINFTCTLEKLKQAESLELAADSDPDLLIEIYRYMAFAQIALGQTNAAAESFRAIFRLNDDFSLSPENVSPKIYTIYQRIKAEMRARQPEPEPEPEPIPEPEPEPEPAPAPVVEPPGPKWPGLNGFAGLDLGPAVPLGEDLDDFTVGVALSAHGSVVLLGSLTLGGRVLYHYAGGKSGQADLHNLGFMGTIGWYRAAGRFWFHLPLSVGLGLWGWDGVADEVGFMWRAEPAAYLRLNDYLSLGLMVAPGGVVTAKPARSSLMLDAGLDLLVNW